MKQFVCLILLLFFIISGIPRVNASHLMGAEITWKCVGQDSFMVKLTVYSDCNGVVAGSAAVNFSCASTGASISALGLPFTTPIDITPVCNTSCTRCQSSSCSFPYGIKRYIMQGLVRLNGAGSCCDIKLSFEQCCRSSAITTGPGNNIFYVSALLNRCQNPCDNSPEFTNPPSLINCVGSDLTYNPGVKDFDVTNSGAVADSITYEWAKPMGLSGNPIGYIGSYDYYKPVYFWGFPNDALPFPRGIHLDPQTGDLQFRPMKPEVTVMVIQVNEFRNGIKIAEIRRDVGFIVISCSPSNYPPNFTTPNNIRSKTVCTVGQTVTFDFTTNDPNSADSITISWDKSIPGAVWTDQNGKLKHPTGTLTWTPTASQISSIPYKFIVTARDNACPVRSSFSQAYEIKVNVTPQANIVVTDLGCNEFLFQSQLTAGAGPSYKWQGKSFSFSPDNLPIVKHKFYPGLYPYTLSLNASGCTKIYSDTVVVTTDTIIEVSLPADTAVYCGRSLSISPKIKYSKGLVKYSWSTGDTVPVLNTGPVLQNTIIRLTVEDSTGCKVTDSIIVLLRTKPLMIPTDTSVCLGSSFGIKAYDPFNIKPVKYYWNSGDTTYNIKTPRIFSGSFYTITSTDAMGCVENNSIIIKVLPDSYFKMLPKDANTCTGKPVTVVPDIYFTKGHVSYHWSTGDTLKTLISGPIYNDSLISLQVSDTTGCTVQNLVFITTLKNPEIIMDSLINICNKTRTTIVPFCKAFGTGNDLVSYRWRIAGNPTVISGQATYTTKDAGFYTLTVTDLAGCSWSDSIRVNVLSAIDTSMTVIGPNITVAPGMKKYYWYWNNKISSSGIVNTYKAYEKGWYYAMLIDNRNCVDSTRSYYIALDEINSQTTGSTFKLFPNPTTGKMILQSDQIITGHVKVSFYNISGREVLNETLTTKELQSEKELDISNLPSGTYTVIIQYQNSGYHQLIIKK